MACGDYPAQQISADPSKAGNTRYVTFEAASPGVCWNQTDKIVVGTDGVNGPSYVELRGVAYGSGITVHQEPLNAPQVVDLVTRVNYPANHIVIDHQNGGRFEIVGAKNFLVENSDLGNCTAVYYGVPGKGGVGNSCEPRIVPSITGKRPLGAIVYTRIHDQRRGAGVAPDCETYNQCHINGVDVASSDGLTFDHDAIWNVDVSGIRFQDRNGSGAGEMHNVTIENSWFGRVTTGQRVGISDDTGIQNLIIRFNSFSSATDTALPYPMTSIVCGGDGVDLRTRGGGSCGLKSDPAKVYGNLWLNAGSCPANTTYAYNVVISHSPTNGTKKCGPTDILHGYGGAAHFPYVRDLAIGAPNFNITGRLWVGDNRIPVKRVKRYPRTDFHGTKRSIWRGRLDAGAVQRKTAPQTRRGKPQRHHSRRKRS